VPYERQSTQGTCHTQDKIRTESSLTRTKYVTENSRQITQNKCHKHDKIRFTFSLNDKHTCNLTGA